MGSKRMGLFCGHTLCTKWDPITDPICETAGVSIGQKGYLCPSKLNPEPKLLKADVQHSLLVPRPSLWLPCSFFIIIGQQIKTKCESAFVVESTERPSDLPTGSLSLLSLWVSVWLSVSRCLYLQYLDSPYQGCLICAENKKPGKTSADVGTDNRLLNNSHTVDLYLKSSARYYYRHLHLSV